ncbi:MAG: type I methionyl aminopeptidase [Candidatus Riflebacteria bacterium RBG_13_59_9]|nr:MAG: type I methionyl aminopeptidase [Candidatus Riflebacteria bacterium RBG_13_59_9]
MQGAIRIKSHQDIRVIYRACQIAARLLNELRVRVRPGASTGELNEFAESFIAGNGCAPAFKGYQGFPAALCTSINEEIVHGIPSRKRVLQEGDILSVDTGVVRDGFYSDTAYTYYVGEGEPATETARLLTATREALAEGVAAVKDGVRLNRVSEAIARRARREGYKVIRDLSGHGVGYNLHEPPTIYNYPVPAGEGIRLRNGMVLAIEPMVSMGTEKIMLADDGWTYSTVDGSLAAHFEHTVAVWDGRHVVLTEEGNDEARALFGPV